MTRTTGLVLAWVVLGVVVWNAVFDWWMSGAVREHLLQAAEYARGAAPEPDLAAHMSEARVAGAERATLWAGIVTLAGLLTIRVARGSRQSRK